MSHDPVERFVHLICLSISISISPSARLSLYFFPETRKAGAETTRYDTWPPSWCYLVWQHFRISWASYSILTAFALTLRYKKRPGGYNLTICDVLFGVNRVFGRQIRKCINCASNGGSDHKRQPRWVWQDRGI